MHKIIYLLCIYQQLINFNHVHQIYQGHIPSETYLQFHMQAIIQNTSTCITFFFKLLLVDLWRSTQGFDFYLILLMWYMLLWWHY